MRVLVVWGSKMGGTEGIARMIGEALSAEGHEVTVRPAQEVRDVRPYEAVIVGGALYANRWHADARRFVERHTRALRQVPVWVFSSGPLDESADRERIPPVQQAATAAKRVGAQGHVTFGGRLLPDAKTFPARSMAKENAGDWRNPERVSAFAREISAALPTARPLPASNPPGGGWGRVAAYGAGGALVHLFALAVLARIMGAGWALGLHAVLLPALYGGLSWRYFGPAGARPPLTVALVFTALMAALDLLLLPRVLPADAAMSPLRSIAGGWLPWLLVFSTTWATGALHSTLPWPKDARPPATAAPAGRTDLRTRGSTSP